MTTDVEEYRNATVSEGTLREQDLVPSFLSALEALDPTEAEVIRARYQPVIDALGDDAALDDADPVGWLMEDLFDALNEAAPEGCRFGAHEGDGALFGFWAEDDEDDEDDV